MPPSANDRMIPVNRGGKPRLVPSSEYGKFKSQIEAWKSANTFAYGKARKVAQEWATEGLMIDLTIYAFVGASKLWLANGLPRAYDASNRVKCLEDSLADMILDDRYFWRSTCEKVEHNLGPEYCAALIKPFKPRGIGDIKNQEGL